MSNLKKDAKKSPSEDDGSSRKPTKIAKSTSTDHSKKPKDNKSYKLRYEFMRRGASVPSKTRDHMEQFHKPPFKRVWLQGQCSENVSDRIQENLKEDNKKPKETKKQDDTDDSA